MARMAVFGQRDQKRDYGSPHVIRVLWMAVVGLALFAGLTPAARATEQFEFSYAGGGVTGGGLLTAELVSPGEWLAISGTDTTSGGPIAGTLTLQPNPNGTGTATSSSGYFLYDNLLFPDSDPMIDNGGLLFVNGTGGEVNLFSYGPDSYTHYDNSGFNVMVSFDPSVVPEPASLALFGAWVGALGLIRRRRGA